MTGEQHGSSKMKTVLYLLYLAGVVPTMQAIGGNDKSYWMDNAQQTLRNALAMRRNVRVAKNVILFLGDGMGVSTVTASRIYKGQKNKQSGEETQLNFEKLPHVALSKTYNVDRQTPDSAGTATAFLCGVKTNMGTLGVDERVIRRNCSNIYNTDTHTQSILKWSLEAGKSVGIVTTTRITHATPGAAYAHIPDRDWEKDSDIPRDTCAWVKDIAYQLLKNNSNIQVILGGGKRAFYNRTDGLNLTEEWLREKISQGAKAKYVQNAAEFRAVSANDTDYLLGLFTDTHMAYELERNNSQEPSITEMTTKAIEILKKNEKGYFLLVEGGRIDHGHHDNIAKRALEDTAAFDDAVGAVKEMTGEDTLIVVTADHSHVFSIAGYASRGNNILGLVDMGDDSMPTDNMPYTTLVYGNGPGPGREQNLTNVNTTTDKFQFQRVVPFPDGSETHGGEDVAIFASGPMAHLFHGVHEQHYIAHVMAYAACVGPNKNHCDNPQDEDTCSAAARMIGSAHAVVAVIMIVTVKIINLI